MLRKLRAKFIFSAMAALLVIIIFFECFVLFLSYFQVYSGYSVLIDYIHENEGQIPDWHENINLGEISLIDQILGTKSVITPESKYQTRFFTVVLKNGEATEVSVDQISSIDEETAESLAEEKYAEHKTGEIIQVKNFNYIYKIYEEDDGSVIFICADCTYSMYNIREVSMMMLIISVFILAVFCVILFLISTRVVTPLVDSVEKQKQFITNAGHELKTPVAIISANTEMIELTSGKSEFTEATMRQVKRLTSLIEELIVLTKITEKEKVKKEDTDISSLAGPIFENFSALALQKNIDYKSNIKDSLNAKTDERAVKEILNILTDNAIKYCDEGGQINFNLSGKPGKPIFTISNSYTSDKPVDCSKFFERFYRADESHTSQTANKGFGIGLSMAKELADTLGHTLTVSYANNVITFTLKF